MKYHNAYSHYLIITHIIIIIIIIIIKFKNYLLLISRNSDYATACTIEEIWSDSRHGEETFVFSEAFRSAVGPTQPPMLWEPEAFSLGARQPVCDHSLPSSTEVKNAWKCRSLTNTPPWSGQGQRYFHFT